MRGVVHVLNGPIFITGASGQLGNALTKAAMARDMAFIAVSRPGFDFEKPETIDSCFHAAHPAMVVNAAAYTAVDAAEQNQAAAEAGNHTGPLRLAELCAAANIPFIHVSTDYVFDGAKGAPYTEEDATAPTGVYGASKRRGEVAIMETEAQAIILRTAWVYAAHGKNFARTMLNAARKTSTLRVVADQCGTPTAAGDLAAVIVDIVGMIQRTGWQSGYRGIYHATNAGSTTWYGFASKIFELAAPLGLDPPTVTPISTTDWPTPARRPADSRLDCSKLAEAFGCILPDWTVPVGPVVLDQQVCMFQPHVLAMQAGQPLVVKNSDPFLHNVHSQSTVNDVFNMAMPTANAGERADPQPKAPEIFKVKCDVHPWMTGWVAVFDHPYFAVTGDDGTFAVKGLPDGTYTLRAWHERYGTKDQTVTVKGGKASADFTFKTDDKPASKK